MLVSTALSLVAAACSYDRAASTEPAKRVAHNEATASKNSSIASFAFTGSHVVSYSSGLCITVYGPYGLNGLDVVQDACVDVANPSPSRWTLVPIGQGPIAGRSGSFNLYHVVNQVNGQCLDDRDGVTSDRAAVQLWPCNATSTTMKWSLGASAPGGYAQLVNARSGKCLDEPFRSSTPGTAMWLYGCTIGSVNPAQEWAFQ